MSVSKAIKFSKFLNRGAHSRFTPPRRAEEVSSPAIRGVQAEGGIGAIAHQGMLDLRRSASK